MLQSQLTSGPSSIAQEAALAGYVELGNKGGTPVETMRKKFQERRDYVMERLRKIDGIEIETPGGAFYAFPDVTKLCGGEKGGFVEEDSARSKARTRCVGICYKKRAWP